MLITKFARLPITSNATISHYLFYCKQDLPYHIPPVLVPGSSKFFCDTCLWAFFICLSNLTGSCNSRPHSLHFVETGCSSFFLKRPMFFSCNFVIIILTVKTWNWPFAFKN